MEYSIKLKNALLNTKYMILLHVNPDKCENMYEKRKK